MYFEANHVNLNEDLAYPYYPRQCSPETLISGSTCTGIQFVRLFARVSWIWASNDNVEVENGDFRCYRAFWLLNLQRYAYIGIASPSTY